MHNSIQLCMIHLLLNSGNRERTSFLQCCQVDTTFTHLIIDNLLEEFEDISQESKALPLNLGLHDHRIPLRPDATPTNTTIGTKSIYVSHQDIKLN